MDISAYLKGYKMRKGNVYNEIIKSYYQIKGIGIFCWVPVLILYILMPCVSYSAYFNFRDMDEMYEIFVETSQYVCPIFSVWFLFFILYHLIEQPGCEVLYVDRIYKLPGLLFPYILYTILMLPLFAVYSCRFSNLWWLYLKLCVVDILYAGIVYAFSYLFRRIVPGIMVVLLYSVLVFMEGNGNIKVSTYFSVEVNTGCKLMAELLPILIMSAILFFIGIVANKRFVEKW